MTTSRHRFSGLTKPNDLELFAKVVIANLAEPGITDRVRFDAIAACAAELGLAERLDSNPDDNGTSPWLKSLVAI